MLKWDFGFKRVSLGDDLNLQASDLVIDLNVWQIIVKSVIQQKKFHFCDVIWYIILLLELKELSGVMVVAMMYTDTVSS